MTDRPGPEPASSARPGFSFFLHGHLPWVIHHGRWPHGVEWLVEATVATYLPLIRAARRLRARGVRGGLTISVSPILAEQLAHPSLPSELRTWIDARIETAAEDASRHAASGESARAALPGLPRGAVYADLNTASPELKRRLAELVGDAGGRFADVALLGPVPGRGLRTPALAAGVGAHAFADAMTPLGMPVEVVSDDPGDAAALKLLRSVFMKGLAAAAVESLEAAEAAGHREWLETEIAEVIGRPLLERLVAGSRTHAARRVDEMDAARELLLELGIEPRIASASAALLADIAARQRWR